MVKLFSQSLPSPSLGLLFIQLKFHPACSPSGGLDQDAQRLQPRGISPNELSLNNPKDTRHFKASKLYSPNPISPREAKQQCRQLSDMCSKNLLLSNQKQFVDNIGCLGYFNGYLFPLMFRTSNICQSLFFPLYSFRDILIIDLYIELDTVLQS